MNILCIDTRDNKRIVIRLKSGGQEFMQESEANVSKAQMALPQVYELLKKADLKPAQIDEIKVETGPGSFTGLRVGVSIANTLSLALGVKVNNNALGTIELPQYGK